MPPIKPPFFNGEELATYEDKKKAIRIIKWRCFKALVGLPLLCNIVIYIAMAILSTILPAPGGNGQQKGSSFFTFVLAFALLYLIIGVLRYIKFIADLPVIKKDNFKP